MAQFPPQAMNFRNLTALPPSLATAAAAVLLSAALPGAGGAGAAARTAADSTDSTTAPEREGGLFSPMRLPETGEHALRILSPDILELTRVNTKPAGETTVPDSWNFIAANGAFTAPAATRFQVTVNGEPAAVTAVYFRRRVVYAPLAPRDLRIGNRLYLKLSAPVPEKARVEVANPDGALWPGSMRFHLEADPLRLSEVIHVNQEGYTSADPKKAMVGYYLGNGGELSVPAGTPFTIVDAETGATAHKGTLTARPDTGFTTTPAPYQKVLQADFSALTASGRYRLKVPGLGASRPFGVSPSMAMTFARAYALGLYNQRCGCAVGLPWSRHGHAACHTAPAFIPLPQADYASTWKNITSTNEDRAKNPRHTAPRLESEATLRYPYVRTGAWDVSGGHHDAGDYSKYTTNSAQLIESLTFAADSLPGAGDLDNLGIPESGDGKSDLLQEAKHEADFLAKMQDTDGGFYFLVYPRDRKYEDNVLPDAGDPQVLFPKTTSATAAAVGALAGLGSSPRFKAQYPAVAASYVTKAQAGWRFLLNAIATHGKDGSYQKITHYADEFMHDDELAWAACAIFLATGDATAHAKLMEWYDPSSGGTRRWSWWRLYESYGCAARAYAFAVSSGRRAMDQLNPYYWNKCRAEVLAGGDDALTRSNESAYGTSYDTESKRFLSAGWYYSLDRAFDMAAAHQIRNRPGYLEAIVANMNYEGGCNPVNVCYITGLGQRPQREIVSQYSHNDRRQLPPSGIPVSNIQSGFAWLHHYTKEPGALTWPPDGARTAPYPMYDRWADTYNAGTEAVIGNQGRGLGTLAWLAARTPAAKQPWNSAPAVIRLPSAYLTPGKPATATLSAPGLDLTEARVVWEAQEQEPESGGPVHQFTPTNSGKQWLEAEAWLPDGRRVAAAASFLTALAEGGSPFTPDADTVALYHFDPAPDNPDGLADASGQGRTLTRTGSPAVTADNTGWMSRPAGGVMRFNGGGDYVSVTIPDSALLPGRAAAPLTVEAWIYPRAWKAWNVANYPILSLWQDWDTALEVKDGMHNQPSCPFVYGGSNCLVSPERWQSLVSLNRWHRIRLTLYGDSTVKCFIDGALAGSAPAPTFNPGRASDWILRFGSFDGDIDEVRVSRAARD